MKFSELNAGDEFYQGAPGTKFGKGGPLEFKFMKLRTGDILYAETKEERCHSCHSNEIFNAWNGSNRVHFCPNTEVWPV